MKNDAVRRYRLKILCDEFGGVGKLAVKLGSSDSQVSQWLNASIDFKSQKPRVMRDSTARRIEAETGKPDGWMDIPPDGAGITAADGGQPQEMNAAEIERRLSVLEDIVTAGARSAGVSVGAVVGGLESMRRRVRQELQGSTRAQ